MEKANDYNQYINSYHDFGKIEVTSEQEQINERETEKLKKKLEAFSDIKTIKEARELAKKLFYIKEEINYIKAGNTYCTIINRVDVFRIVLNNENELLCYNYVKR